MSFTRVTKNQPCPICKRGDWCRVFADGWAECMRVPSDKPATSGGWMHRLRGELTPHPGPMTSSPPLGRSLPDLRSEAHSFRRSAAEVPGRGGEGERKPPTINATKLMRDWIAATSATALEEFAASLGVSAPSLVAVGAAWAASHSAWAFPMCDGHGNVVGIRLRNERGKFAVRGSKQGIFLANIPTQKTLFVCEGPTDTAAAVELGLFAVGRPNCCCGGAEIKVYARRHECSRVAVISDNDKPGLDGARKVGGELKLPFAIYVPPAKDVREFVRLGGTRIMIENTLKGTLWRNG